MFSAESKRFGKPTAADFATTQKYHVCQTSHFTQGWNPLAVKEASTCTTSVFSLKRAWLACRRLKKIQQPAGTTWTWGVARESNWLMQWLLAPEQVYENNEELDKFIEATPEDDEDAVDSLPPPPQQTLSLTAKR